jgi:hypothetical protein
VSGPAASGLDVLVFGAAVWKLEKRSESQRSVLGRVGEQGRRRVGHRREHCTRFLCSHATECSEFAVRLP